MAIRSVMKPGRHPLEAGLSGSTPATGSRVRTATQSPVAWVRTLVELDEVHAGLEGHRGRLGGGQHLRRVRMVAELDHLTHPRATDVDDACSEGVQYRSDRASVASSPPTIRVSVPASAPAVPSGEGGVEEPGTGRGDPLVLLPLDVGVDRRAVDDDVARPQGGQHRRHHLVHLRGARHTEHDDVGGLRVGRGSTVGGTERHGTFGPGRGCARPRSPGDPPRPGGGSWAAPSHRGRRIRFPWWSSSSRRASRAARLGAHRAQAESQAAVPDSSSSTHRLGPCEVATSASGSGGSAALAQSGRPAIAAATVISAIDT